MEGCLQCYGGVLAVFWRGVAFLEGTCSVLEVRDILEEALPVFWRGVVFLEGACRGGMRGACNILEGHDILEEVHRCGICACSVWRGVAFLEGCLQCFGGA